MSRVAFLVITIVLLGGGCDPTELRGELTFDDTSTMSWRFRPTSCLNGDTRQFYGVDLFDGRAAVRLFQHPVWGWMVTAARDGNLDTPETVLTLQSSCSRFDPSLTYDRCTRCSKGDTDEDDSTMSGHLELDCALARGGHLGGRVEFEYCNNPEEQ